MSEIEQVFLDAYYKRCGCALCPLRNVPCEQWDIEKGEIVRRFHFLEDGITTVDCPGVAIRTFGAEVYAELQALKASIPELEKKAIAKWYAEGQR